jgi:hypothetical protein
MPDFEARQVGASEILFLNKKDRFEGDNAWRKGGKTNQMEREGI